MTNTLREAAEKAFDAEVAVTMFQKGSKSQQDADVVRIMALSEMRYKTTPTTILSLLDRLAAAEAENAKLRGALKPFAGAVYNDNGDVTIERSHIRIEHYLAARTAQEKPNE